MDDWRLLPSLTLNFGVRWEFFAPYTEKYNHLADVATNPDGEFSSETEQSAGMNSLPNSLVLPWHKAFQPRVGLAWRVPKIKQTVGACRIWIELQRWRVRDVCDQHGPPASLY
ncbi:MAG: hypothetical protein WDM87_00590 [Terracidiphilus sp.]